MEKQWPTGELNSKLSGPSLREGPRKDTLHSALLLYTWGVKWVLANLLIGGAGYPAMDFHIIHGEYNYF